MRFTFLFGSFAVVVAINAAANTSPIDAITQALEHGDFVDAAIDILTLGSCDVSNLADCVGVFAPIVMDCGLAALDQGTKPSEDLKCFEDTLEAIGTGSGPKGFGTCAACIEEGISIAQSLLKDI
ncbi:hypothetical protein BGW36DRAFT_354464 [Talaromyces proteolyticus]|uniref:Fungal calcium binding protein domain-containing protein n=1 Tax=Talaromyces proteolyticus TaxID=1131652 RepID=A0AAD4Q4F0_9EURO|nr:uncharacterized protein BGW36DRAFT_354464 [Talaromyces proteolyticus]KAH8703024.1 hypothetical protein BGW36DRAFT_354464 [Talaromyces proteolyticus]